MPTEGAFIAPSVCQASKKCAKKAISPRFNDRHPPRYPSQGSKCPSHIAFKSGQAKIVTRLHQLSDSTHVLRCRAAQCSVEAHRSNPLNSLHVCPGQPPLDTSSAQVQSNVYLTVTLLGDTKVAIRRRQRTRRVYTTGNRSRPSAPYTPSFRALPTVLRPQAAAFPTRRVVEQITRSLPRHLTTRLLTAYRAFKSRRASQVGSRLLKRNPVVDRRQRLCVRRATRRQVIFAKGVGGRRGLNMSRQRPMEARYSCR